MKLLGLFASLVLAVAAHGQGTANPGGGGGMNYIVPNFIAKNGGTSTGLTNTGGFFLGGTGVIGTNGSTSTLTVNMPTTFSNRTDIILPTGTSSNIFGGASTNTWIFSSLSRDASGNQSLISIRKAGATIGSLGFRDNDIGGLELGTSTAVLNLGSGNTWKLVTAGGSPCNLTGSDGSGLTMTGSGAGLNITTPGRLKLGGGAFFTSNNTAVLIGAEWPALTLTGDYASNVVACVGATQSNTTFKVDEYPLEPTCVYRAGFFTNNAVVVYRTAIAASQPVVTNTVRVSIVDW